MPFLTVVVVSVVVNVVFVLVVVIVNLRVSLFYKIHAFLGINITWKRPLLHNLKQTENKLINSMVFFFLSQHKTNITSGKLMFTIFSVLPLRNSRDLSIYHLVDRNNNYEVFSLHCDYRRREQDRGIYLGQRKRRKKTYIRKR